MLQADRVDNDDDAMGSEGDESVRAPVDGSAVGRMAEAGDGPQHNLCHWRSLRRLVCVAVVFVLGGVFFRRFHVGQVQLLITSGFD